jgi:hypothetical protein
MSALGGKGTLDCDFPQVRRGQAACLTCPRAVDRGVVHHGDGHEIIPSRGLANEPTFNLALPKDALSQS